MDDAGAKLLAAVEALVLEVRSLRETMSRDSTATSEVDELRRKAADLDSLRARNAERKKRNRIVNASRDSTATNDNHPKPLESVSRDGHATSQVLKALSFVVDQDQEQKKKVLATSRDGHATQPKTGELWTAYLTAYRLKYGIDPVRNKKVNGQLSNLVDRLGAAAPDVATFYLGHRDAFYARDRHGVGLLLRDCEKLHTDWQMGEQVTATGARLEEQSAENFGSWAKHLKGAG